VRFENVSAGSPAAAEPRPAHANRAFGGRATLSGVRGHVARVSDLRGRIRRADGAVSHWERLDLWSEARSFASSMKDDLRYTACDCSETYPFHESWEFDPLLEVAGREYCEYRAGLMVANDQGLTVTNNRLPDPYERDPEVEKLRALHAAVDGAVLAAYSWSDIPADWEFLSDFEIDEEEWCNRKNPCRYRGPDELQTKVLARTLELDAERARAESVAGAAKERARKESTAHTNDVLKRGRRCRHSRTLPTRPWCAIRVRSIL